MKKGIYAIVFLGLAAATIYAPSPEGNVKKNYAKKWESIMAELDNDSYDQTKIKNWFNELKSSYETDSKSANKEHILPLLPATLGMNEKEIDELFSKDADDALWDLVTQKSQSKARENEKLKSQEQKLGRK